MKGKKRLINIFWGVIEMKINNMDCINCVFGVFI